MLVTVGDLVEDVIVWSEAPARHATDNPCVVRRSRGGSAANVAEFASALMPARFIGCVGEDPAADMLTSELAGHGVDVRVQRRGRTGTVVVIIDSGGERTMYPDRAASADLAEVPDAWLESAAVLHAPSYCFASEPAATSVLRLIKHARHAGVPVSMDASSTGMIEEYGLARAQARAYEVDYLITPALGGADDIHNIWPEPYTDAQWNARVKDALEERLRMMVCEGEVDLATAQREIAGNWIEAYKKYFRTDHPIEYGNP